MDLSTFVHAFLLVGSGFVLGVTFLAFIITREFNKHGLK